MPGCTHRQHSCCATSLRERTRWLAPPQHTHPLARTANMVRHDEEPSTRAPFVKRRRQTGAADQIQRAAHAASCAAGEAFAAPCAGASPHRSTHHFTSGRRSSHLTCPLVASSTSGQCSAGTRPPPRRSHALTVAGFSPMARAIFAGPPTINKARFNALMFTSTDVVIIHNFC